MGKKPFYRYAVCSKVLGGKRSLWHARLTEEGKKAFLDRNIVGAGGTADLAIRDLQKTINLLKRR